jgi:hypothetical protein
LSLCPTRWIFKTGSVSSKVGVGLMDAAARSASKSDGPVYRASQGESSFCSVGSAL